MATYIGFARFAWWKRSKLAPGRVIDGRVFYGPNPELRHREWMWRMSR